MRARPYTEGIEEVTARYELLQSGAKKLGDYALADVIALEQEASIIETVGISDIPWLLQEEPDQLDLLRREGDLKIVLPDLLLAAERKKLLIAAGTVGLHGANVMLRAVLSPGTFANTRDDEPRSVFERRSAAAHVLHLATHPYLDTDFRIIQSDMPHPDPAHPIHREVTTYRHTMNGPAIGASAITVNGGLEVFQAPESIALIGAFTARLLREANENRPVGPVAPDGFNNHLDIIAGIAQGD